jgi:hypothetical protein
MTRRWDAGRRLVAWGCPAILTLAVSCALPAGAGAREPSSRIFVLADGGRPWEEPFVDVAQAGDGSLVVAAGGYTSGRVLRLSSDGALSVLARYSGTATSGSVGVLAEPDGSTLVADGWSYQLRRLRPDGTTVTVAGSGRGGFAGDGGPATVADLNLAASGASPVAGLASMPDRSLLFTDVGNHRIRRIDASGTIATVAGSGPVGSVFPPFGGDGGPAVAAQLYAPHDVLAMSDGGFLVSDTGHARVRRVTSDGTIFTIAGNGDSNGKGDGGPATLASVPMPSGLATLPGGELAIADGWRVRRVGHDRTISTLVNLAPLARRAARRGDFAGRTAPYGLGGLAVTTEGGLAMAAGHLYYLAPPHTARTLLALRDARVSERKVTVEFDATQPGSVRVEVKRGGRRIASAADNIQAGRRIIRVAGRFARRTHTVAVTLTGSAGATARDAVSLYTSRVLPMRSIRQGKFRWALEEAASGEAGDTGELGRCHRQTARRIDCLIRDVEDGGGCWAVLAVTLKRSGVVFYRPYGCRSTSKHPFRRHPRWSDPAQALLELLG